MERAKSVDPVPLQGALGLVFRRPEEIALVREEAFGRLEVTLADGSVLFRPGPLSLLDGGPWVRGEGLLVHPRHARQEVDHLVLPGGWRIPWTGGLPEPRPGVASPVIPRLGVRRDEVIYLHAETDKTRWVVDTGEIPEDLAAVHARKFHPGLVPAGNHYINPVRLRAIRGERSRFRLFLDRGIELTVYHNARGPLQEGLGLPQLYALEPWTAQAEVLLREGMRDWPCELFRASEEFVKANLAVSYPFLVANVLWQTVRMRQMGLDPDYNVDHRGYWYRPLETVLVHAGMLSDSPPGVPSVIESPEGGDPEREANLVTALRILEAGGDVAPLDLFRKFQILLADLIWGKVFDYRDLGFEEARSDLREIGESRPGVVVLVEKATTRKMVRALARTFGATFLILGGQASLLITEFFAAALRERWSGPVRVVAYVDYDPWGWAIARAFCRQLARYGVEVEDLRFLVRPERFTEEELQALPVPLPSTTEEVRKTVDNWLAETGGVRGARLGIHADHLRPVARLVQAMREETGLEPVGGAS